MTGFGCGGPPFRLLLAALAVGAALRLGAVGFYRNAPLTAGGDDRQYYELAESLADGKGFARQDAPSAYRAPLHPLSLAAAMKITGRRTPGALRLFQVLFSVAAILFVFLAGRKLHSPLAGAAAAWLLALSPEQILLPASLYLECLYAALCALVLWRWAEWGMRPGRREWAYLCLSVGLSLAARSFLAPLIALLLAIRLPSDGASKTLGRALAAAALAGLFIFPWAARNKIQFGRWIPFESGVAGPVLFYAAEGFIYAPAEQAGVEPMKTMYETLHHTQWDEYSLALAGKRIAENPAAYLQSTLKRAWALWSDAYLPYLLHDHPALAAWMESRSHWNRLRALDLAGRLFLLMLGLFALRHMGIKRLLPAAGLAAYFTLYAFGTVFPRFLAPAGPALCVLAGVGAALILSRRSAPSDGAR